MIDMALFGDIERIAIIGAEAEKRRRHGRDDAVQGMEILASTAFADEDLHALAQFLPGLVGIGGLMAVADAAAQIGIERVTAPQRRMAIDMAVPEGLDLVEDMGHFVE